MQLKFGLSELNKAKMIQILETGGWNSDEIYVNTLLKKELSIIICR